MDNVFDENNPEGLEDLDEDIDVSRTIIREDKSSKASKDFPVSNASDIPLFVDADKRSTKTGSYLNITKIDRPNSGFKGRILLNSTLETISKLFGNGIYNIDLCNEKGQVLRTKEGCEISIPDSISDSPSASNSPSRSFNPSNSDNISTLIKSVHLTNKETQAQQVALAKEVGDRTVKLAESHTQSIIESSKSSAERDRSFMDGVLSREREFFAAQQVAANNMFIQMMAMMDKSHQMTLQVINSQNENKKDPIELLVTGIQLAQSLTSDSEDPPWLKGIDKGANMISNIANMAMLKSQNTKTTNTLPDTSTKSKTKPKLITKTEAKAILELKETLRKRGIDFEKMLTDTVIHYASTPSPENSGSPSEDNAEPDEPDSDSEGDPTARVE